MSVLVVDDNSSNVALLEALLVDQGLSRVYGETDPRQVPQRLAEHDPDLVLLDLHMPYVDGHHVLRQIQRFAAGNYLPVLVLTADTTTDARDRALGSGAHDFLTKPIDEVETALRVANLLGTRQLFRALRRAQPGAPPSERPAGDGQTRERILTVLQGHAISPVYQPVVDIASERTIGHEGLARFVGLDHGGPAAWFADAFDVGLGVELEWLAAQRAVTNLDAMPADTFLAVNMSPASILRLDERVLGTPETWHRLVIELTEHVPIEDYSALHSALEHMRGRGARLAADDLGAGYAGFRHLISLEPDIIKLDISLVSGIHRNKGQRALASALVAFANDVGARVIAEGVEERAELQALRDIGVPWAQGYHLGRPAPFPI